MAEVTKIYLCKEKKQPRVEIEEGMLLEDFGLEGDAYSEHSIDKQVTIFFEESRVYLSEETVVGLCFPKFLETIRISNLNKEELKSGLDTGRELQVGETLIQISKPRKKCYPECEIVKKGRHCVLSRKVRFCKVLQSGIIRVGDGVDFISL